MSGTDAKELAMHRIALATIASLTAAACRSAAQAPETPPQPIAAVEPAQAVPAEAALEALESARAAVASWRSDVEQGAKLDDGALLSLRAASQSLGREVQALMAQFTARDAASMPSPKVQAERSMQDLRSNEIAQLWVDDIRALGAGAAERRAKALEELRAELAGGKDETRQLAALQTLSRVGDVDYDKASFRPLVLPFARNGSGALLRSGLFALPSTELRPEDIELVYAAWDRDQEAVRDWTLHLLSAFGAGRIEGRSEQIALEYLTEVDSRAVNQVLNGLWGAQVGPELEARVLELARSDDWELRHGAIYFGLSTFEGKSEAVVDALIETLSDPDFNNWQRALWGLGHGVPPALQPKVAAALVDLHNNRSDPSVRESCRRIVAQYGGPEYENKLLK
jgi:hypothetical protein